MAIPQHLIRIGGKSIPFHTEKTFKNKQPLLRILLSLQFILFLLSSIAIADNDEKEALRNIEKFLNWNHKDYVKRGRENGVLLQSKVEVKELKGDNIIFIHWTIDYNGPRQPLHILKPTLDVHGYNHTYIFFSLFDKLGNERQMALHAKYYLSRRIYTKEHFLTIKEGETAKGTLTVSMNLVKEIAGQTFQSEIQGFFPNLLYLRLQHSPKERGEPLNLDAWTGGVQTNLIRVPIKKE